MILSALTLLIILGGAVSFYYGQFGFMPLDQSILFDAGWRILSGQTPFCDFVMPCGMVPAMLQALCFKIFGVTWNAYLLHAAVFNGLFCALAFLLLRAFGAGLLLSFFYALATAFFFYAPFGTPYMDQHAFFFLMAALTAAGFAHQSVSPRTKTRLWFLIPVLLGLSVFSKQNPAFFGFPLIAFLFLLDRSNIFKRLFACFWGALLILSLSTMAFAMAGASAADFREFFWDLPSALGKLRWITLQETPGLRAAAEKIFEKWELRSLHLVGWSLAYGFWFAVYQNVSRLPSFLKKFEIPLRFVPFWFLTFRSLKDLEKLIIFYFPYEETRSWLMLSTFAVLALAGMLFGAADFRVFAGRAAARLEPRRAFWILAAVSGMTLISLLFAMTTRNQYENAVPWILVSLGLSHLLITGPLHSIQNSRLKYFLILTVSFVFLHAAVMDTWTFHKRVNLARAVHDFKPSFQELPEDTSGILPPALAGLRWKLPPSETPYKLDDFSRLLDFLKSNDGNFFIFGDSTILYGLAGKPSAGFSLWWHPGLTMPYPENSYFANYERRLLERLFALNVRYLVIEGRQTWMGLRLEKVPSLHALANHGGRSTVHFGPFQVIEISLDNF